MKEILKLDHIQKYYGSEGGITRAIRDISFTVEEGEFLGIMGASGSGKTTLLNCISTIDTVSAGHIYLDGEDVTDEGIHTGLGATILMVTHDAFTASYAGWILFLRDGEIFTELRRGGDTRGAFFEKILHVLTMMGGGNHDVR